MNRYVNFSLTFPLIKCLRQFYKLLDILRYYLMYFENTGIVTFPLSVAGLDNFTIAVSNDSFENTSSYMTCYEETGATNGASVSQEITCLQPVWGRYLVIRKLENNSEVQVCEVQIYGGRFNFCPGRFWLVILGK